MGAHGQRDVSCCQPLQYFFPVFPFFPAGEKNRLNPGGLGQRRNGGHMLARQNLRRRHDNGLGSGLGGGQHGEKRNNRFTVSHIAL